jgi:hypothetical protein
MVVCERKENKTHFVQKIWKHLHFTKNKRRMNICSDKIQNLKKLKAICSKYIKIETKQKQKK